MHDEVHGTPRRAGLADLWSWKNDGRATSCPSRTRGEQGDAPLGRDEAGAQAGGDDGAGQVDQLAVLAPGPGGDHDGPAGAQQGGAAGQDLR